MCAMKKYIPLLLACAALAGCTINTAPSFGAVTTTESGNGKATYRLAGSHWTDVSKIRDEATRLNDQVGQKKITKVQAAQHLNRFRLKLVGSNPVDDSVYEVYLRSAVDSQRGAITSAQSKQYVQNALKGWQQRWPNMRNKPNNPAFTNFLMELMNIPPSHNLSPASTFKIIKRLHNIPFSQMRAFSDGLILSNIPVTKTLTLRHTNR